MDFIPRVIVLAIAWSATYLVAGVRLLLTAPGVSVLGQHMLGGALVAYGALRIGGPFLHLVGPNPVLAQFVTFGGRGSATWRRRRGSAGPGVASAWCSPRASP